jgi:hypothetical protein
MPRIPLLLLAFACACGSVPLLEPPKKKIETEFPVVEFHEGQKPRLEELAVLLVLTPTDDEGLCVLGRIHDTDSQRDYRPPVRQAILELRPGQYDLEVYYWVARSRFDLNGALVMENLQSATMVPMTIDVAAGKAYALTPELRRSQELSAEAREGFHPLALASSFSQVKTPPRQTHLTVTSHVWRPHLTTIPAAEAEQYRSYR